MTPKQKAIELTRRFNNLDSHSQYNHNAQECALVVVDEVWDALNLSNGCGDVYNFWSNVKFEIEEL